MKSETPWLLLLWGAPAAGKSTLCRHLKKQYQTRKGLELCHLGTDRLNQAVIDENFDPTLREEFYASLVDLSGRLLGLGRSVLLEGTFLGARWRRALHRTVEQTGARLLSVQVECRLGLRQHRNRDRAPHQHVPEQFLTQSHYKAKLQMTEADYVFDTELMDPARLAEFLMGVLRI